MPAILTTPPALEPLSLTETKAHLKVGTGDDDSLITRLITTARQHVEKHIDKVLITQNWSIFFDDWPGTSQAKLPVAPVTAITNLLRTYSDDDVASIIEPAHYYADLIDTPQHLVLRGSRIWLKPGRVANGIEIEVTAGYGPSASDVPEPLREAMLLLIAHWYEHRQAECSAGSMTGKLQSLLTPYKRVRL